MRLRLALALGLLASPSQAQEPMPVHFDKVSCTPEQVAAGSTAGTPVVRTSSPSLELPTLKGPRPEPIFAPSQYYSAPLWAYLTFVVDTTGTIDLCTVRIVRQNEPKWTRAVLAVLEDYRYHPGQRDGAPVRVLIEEGVYYRPPFR